MLPRVIWRGAYWRSIPSSSPPRSRSFGLMLASLFEDQYQGQVRHAPFGTATTYGGDVRSPACDSRRSRLSLRRRRHLELRLWYNTNMHLLSSQRLGTCELCPEACSRQNKWTSLSDQVIRQPGSKYLDRAARRRPLESLWSRKCFTW